MLHTSERNRRPVRELRFRIYLSLRSVIVSLRRFKFVFLPRRAMEGSFNIELAKMMDDGVLTAMIVGEIDVTRDSPDAEVCTHHTTRYEATIESMKVHIWEVSGFNQPKKDPKKNAPDIEDKFRPILEAKASVNVVLFCMQDQKLTGMTMRIFELIHGMFEKCIPIALAISHWERERDMQDWCRRNQGILGTSISGTRHVCVTGLRNAGYEGKWRELREELVAVLIEYGPARGRTAVPLEPALRYYLGRSGQTDGGWLTRLRRRLGRGGASLTVSATVCWSKGAKNATGCAAVNALDGGLEYLADVRGQRVVFSSHNYVQWNTS
ncbi:hypothetical protein F5141DRAFT_1202471 [Pisolithus sp. B1]|nr:hypothetical protein F5141DRAFT_1202471 [Pisolithus sp. B1]